jgi:L-alanine-DL-glutamate epimerase-like enolase superfamily enzyme
MKLRVASCPFPFRGSFEHASAVRERAENVIIVAEGTKGQYGLGEGCPRSYVTGETVATALDAITRWRQAGVEEIADVATLTAWMERNRADIDTNPSAFAAIEIALLDLFARQAGQPIERLLGIAAQDIELRTSAVYSSGGSAKFLVQAALFNLNGMGTAKLKVSGNAQRDRRRARLLSRFGALRIDANNLWASAEAAIAALKQLQGFAWAVEEPISSRNWQGLAEVGAQTGMTIILDESVTRQEDLAALVSGATYILNARVSKQGGLLRTLAIIRAARERGMKIIVGAQVGETSILARAGIVAARAAAEDLVAFEGAFGTRLLVRDAVMPSIGFGYRGRVRLDQCGGTGLGLTPTAEVANACR